MLRRARAIPIALILLAGFLYLTSRHSSHPRDLHSSRFRQEFRPSEELRPILKEPPGKWDPLDDTFRAQQKMGGANGLKNQNEEIEKLGLDLPDEELRRKTPKKPAKNPGKVSDTVNNAKEEPQVQKQLQNQGNPHGPGSGAVVIEEEAVPKPYDPEEDLKVILAKAPLIIFSKTHCPHSRDAKKILLENHKISPEPYVVEIDRHPHGAELQVHLGRVTGRRTVPNVMASGISIGGGDEMRAMESAGTVAQTLLTRLAGKITVDGKRAV